MVKVETEAKPAKNPVGRPKLDRDKLKASLREYIDLHELPVLEEWTGQEDITRETASRLAGEDEEFCDLFIKLREKMVNCLIHNGLNGDYNPKIVHLILSCHGYAETHRLVVEGEKKIKEIDGTVTDDFIRNIMDNEKRNAQNRIAQYSEN